MALLVIVVAPHDIYRLIATMTHGAYFLMQECCCRQKASLKRLDYNTLEEVAHHWLLPSTSMRTLRAVLGDVDPDLAVRFCSTQHHKSVPRCTMRNGKTVSCV